MNDENVEAPSDGQNLPPTSAEPLKKCLGTRRLTNLRHENGTFSEGMVATFLHREENQETTPILLVLVTDGTLTFQGTMDPNQATRVQWNNHRSKQQEQQQQDETITDEIKIQILSSFLLQNQDGMNVTYTYQQANEETTILKLEIKHRMANVTRILGSHTLEPLKDSNLTFCQALGSVVNDSLSDIQTLEMQHDTMHTNLLGWKTTAETLDRDWQNEKNALLHRFLQLYQTAHEQLGQAQAKVELLEQELMHLRASHNSSSDIQKRTVARPPPPALTYAALPDDHDAEQFDSNTVELLAGGQAIDKPMATKRKRSSSSSDGMNGVGAMRRNPHTGAKEVFDANALFEDASFFASASQTMEHATTTTSNTNESHENGKPESKTINDGNQQKEKEVDPVMAIANKLAAKKSATREDDAPTAKRAKKDSTNANGKKDNNSSAATNKVDPVMAAAGKLFGNENNTSNGGSP